MLVLPEGVDKRSGLAHALERLGLRTDLVMSGEGGQSVRKLNGLLLAGRL